MEKKTSVFLTILICILGAVAGGGASYLYLSVTHNQEKQALNEQINKLETQLTQLQKEAKNAEKTTTTTATTTTDPTANWKNYTDPIAKLSFKYPETWTKDPRNRDYSPLLLNSPTKINGRFLQLSYHFPEPGDNQPLSLESHPAYITNVTPITLSGSSKTFYLVASSPDKTETSVGEIFLSDKKYTVGKINDDVVETFTTPSGTITSLKALLTMGDAQEMLGYAYTDFTNHPDYPDLIRIFKSVTFTSN